MRSVLFACAALAACADEGAQIAASAAPAHFTLRGRWPGAPRLGWWIEDADAPVPAADWRRAVERALAVWAGSGIVEFVAAAAPDTADVAFGWRRGRHGDCEPFDTGSAVAHSGPVRRGTFVHFDLSRHWSADGDAGHSLFHVALHEIGHVLGLGHSEAADSVMRTGTVTEGALAAADLMGLHTLYGGGAERAGDLRILDAQGRTLAMLHGVAPPGITDFAVFDTDGDGVDEVLVWRTDRAGNGMLMVHRFGPGALPDRTTGPVYGVSAPGVPNVLVRTPAGERLWVCAFAAGRVVVFGFDAQGLIVPRGAEDPAAGLEGLVAAALRDGLPRSGDLDGDGRAERVVRVR